VTAPDHNEGKREVPMADSGSSSSIGGLLAALGGLKVHDASPTISADMPMWFMYEAPEIAPLFGHAEAGAAANRVALSEHTGTHVDAPFHFDADGLTADEVPVDAMLLRPFGKFDLKPDDHQPGDLIGPEHLAAAAERGGFSLEPGSVAIIEFGWDANRPGGANGRPEGWWGSNEPGLSPEACTYLTDLGVVAVACDTPACDVAARDGEMLGAHGHVEHFLPQGILIVEGLTGLADVPATGLFLALPLKIAGGTGSPLRVVLLTD
jgi:kynurenine formamidase